MTGIKRVGITGHYANRLAKRYARQTVKLLEKLKVAVDVDRALGIAKKGVPLDDFGGELIIAFGGDGTLLHVSRHLKKNTVPVLGVHCGERGYLLDWDYAAFEKELPQILKRGFVVEERSRLEVKNMKTVPLAVNEFALVPKASGQLMKYDVKVDGEFVWSDASDGVLVATPTGSTAHASSAGGPMISPKADVVEIVSLNSNYKDKRPMVVPDTATVELLNFHELWGCELIVDGQRRVTVEHDLVIGKGKPFYLARRKKAEAAQKASVKGLSPSARFIYKVLELGGSLSQKEVLEETGLPERTVRRNLEQLLEAGLIVKETYHADVRKTLYEVR